MEASTAERNGPAKILIVEDERIVAMDLAETLRELGYAVVGMAARGEDAIQRAAELSPALILMDVRLAGKLDGVQAADAIRSKQDIPVIYLTAHSDNETLKRAASTSASGYLVKPFKSPELRCAIEIALHKHATDARLRENEQWLSTTLRSIAEAVIATDASGNVRLFNPVAEALTEWPHTEATAHPVEDVLAIVDERTGVLCDNPVRTVLKSGLTSTVVDGTALLSRSGRVISIEECAAPIVDSFGKLLGGVVVLRDITERRRQHQRIQQLNRDLERRVEERTEALQTANDDLESFSYSVAHDLRAPLRSIDGFSQLLVEQHAAQLEPQALGHLNRVRQATLRMSNLIDALLALALARVGRSEFEPQDVDLTMLAESIAAELMGAYPERTVKTTIQPGLRARCDARLMRQILFNLLENAWKFTSKCADAEVAFGSTVRPEGSCFFIKDNGAGFDSAKADRLFAPFKRLHAESEYPGTGIGLAFVRRALARQGGSIWAESQPGKGCTFLFTVPTSLH